MVVYTGRETRAQMNNQQPRTKVGLLDQEINFLSKILFALMVLFAATIVVLNGFHGNFALRFFRFILLLCSIIPISLRVNLDLAKIWYSHSIDSDKQIHETITRNSTIPEELGRIEVLFSDKTGTLTQNDMIMKKIVMEFAQFSVDTMDDFKNLLDQNVLKHDGPIGDVKEGEKRRKRRDPEFSSRDLATALMVCHNVTPVWEDGEKEFQASSPDEVALVKFIDSLGHEIQERDDKKVVLKAHNGSLEEYQILANFPFSSDTKRMGILVRHIKSNRIIFYLKGAEVVIEEKVLPTYRGVIKEACENLGMEGLRTLVITQRLVSEEEYKEWERNYKAA